MRPGIPFSRSEGCVSRQAHADLPEGTFERETGREGFFGPAAHFYHRHAPTGWTDFEGPLRPHAYDTRRLDASADSPWRARELFFNDQVRYRFWRPRNSMTSLARNADGDELLFVHSGQAELYCDYGHLTLREGDYLILPRGTMWRLEVASPVELLMIEATGSRFSLADRGLLGAHALFDPAVLDVPGIDEAFRAQQDECEWTVDIKRQGAISRLTYPWNPLDAVGWKGDLAPVRLNWRDIRPVSADRYHLPPSAHTTVVADGFVVCTFCPRPLEQDPGALKLPFYHSNDDYDEVLFYHAGDFMSRDDIAAGAITFHPSGFPHGPHPKALATAMKASRSHTDEVAVMLDTRKPLEIGEAAPGIENPDYVDSWRTS
ncbi:MAG TPA: homogentisate 1,2-dioxygenase [Deltaproteobacteria bacterium]|nr:homogentisate 1,2-dioxygenase [Deltaproteobacteria bacterium]